jgi:hypothetical protein
MKSNFLVFPLVLFCVLFVSSCKKEATPTEDLMEMEMISFNIALLLHLLFFLLLQLQ